MSWRIRWDGHEMNSDEFTVAELGEIERTSRESWAVANPFRTLPVARAFLAVLMLRNGVEKGKVAETISALTLKDLKKVFEFIADEDDEEDSESGPLDKTPDQLSLSS